MATLPAGGAPNTAHTPPLHHGPWAAQIGDMETVVRWLRASSPYLEALAGALVDALRAGGRLYIFGNGGSATQASHFATELVGRFHRNRHPLPAQALPADGSLLT
ncbi:MAG TPA: SIS domain-containing protein, partial [Limnochordales bacterium]